MAPTNKKIRIDSTDRRSYYAPSGHGRVCPYLMHDEHGEMVMEPDLRSMYTARKGKRAICSQQDPVCSYHLGDYNSYPTYATDELGEKIQETDESGMPLFTPDGKPIYVILSETRSYFCHRYLPWREQGEPAVVDTHGTRLQPKGRTLGWY